MNLKVDIPSAVEGRLSEEAAAGGLSLQELVLQILSSYTRSSLQEWKAEGVAAKQSYAHHSIEDIRESPGQHWPQVVLTDLIHSLFARTNAIGAAARQMLTGEPGQLARYDSLYRFLEASPSLKEAADFRAARLLSFILREVDLYRNYIANLLGALNSTSPPVIHREPVDLNSLTQEVVDLFLFIAREKRLQIHLDSFELSVNINVDRELTRRVLINLIDNAVKYSYFPVESTRGRFVSVRVRRHSARGDYAVGVQSFGVGILKEELSSGIIFGYGRRGALARDRDRSGNGIGLAEAKRIVDAHGGHIKVTSEPQAGESYLTTVTVVFPPA